MSFDDLAARFRQRAGKNAPQEQKPPNFEELYLVRARILGVLIRDARQALHMPAEECAERVGVSVETLEAWELGQSTPSLPQLELLAYALGVPISHFWGTETVLQQEKQRVNTAEYVAVRDRLIGAVLRAARERANLSVEQLAAKAGVPAADITAYELGQRPIPTPVLATLASACNVSMSYFLENGNRIGQFLLLQEDMKHFSALPDDLRKFVASPVNRPYLELAQKIARLGSDELRRIAEAILEITL